jgi:hypothetical protein
MDICLGGDTRIQSVLDFNSLAETLQLRGETGQGKVGLELAQPGYGLISFSGIGLCDYGWRNP